MHEDIWERIALDALAISQYHPPTFKLGVQMQKNITQSVALCAVILALSTAAFAAPQDVVTGPGKQPVKSERFGTCVQTKWSAANDPCEPAQVKEEPAPAPASAPAVAAQPVNKLVHEQLTIYFDYNKSTVNAASAAKLDAVASAVNRSPKVTRVNIVGYTDELGTQAYNEKLSTARADAVKEYLAKRTHIDVGVVGLRGLGSQDPVVDCKKAKSKKKKIACMAKDRRVEIEFEFQK
jgi:outer membrane protein OmpA-like peptidoglycan-associated protein